MTAQAAAPVISNLDTVPVPIVIADATGAILSVNEAASRVIGVPLPGEKLEQRFLLDAVDQLRAFEPGSGHHVVGATVVADRRPPPVRLAGNRQEERREGKEGV